MDTTIVFFNHFLHQACFVSNVLGKVVDLTTLNILRTARAMLMRFCIVILQDVRFLFWGDFRVFADFIRFLPQRLKAVILKSIKL